MNQEIRILEPKSIWNNFANLNAVPRASKKEQKVITFIEDFGKKLNLPTFKDKVGNVIIKKPATQGMQNRKTIILQAHLDMVHQKNSDTIFDFENQGIEMYIENNWVKAKGTTLGADNGLGVATIMAILESTTIAHPAIEALFTIDEETGMTGALNLEKEVLNGKILLNLDTEDDDVILIGCAGGINITATRKYETEIVPENAVGYEIKVKGLTGGHSGVDIHKGLGNANKIMNRLLFNSFENFGLQISEIQGGSLRNAIPRESSAKIVIASAFEESFIFDMQKYITEIKKEFEITDPNLLIEIKKSILPKNVMDLRVQEGFIRAIYAAHNGIYRMNPNITELVETSNNIALINIKNGQIKIDCLARSATEIAKQDICNSLQSVFELIGCEVNFSGDYPGWESNTKTEILNILTRIYETQNHQKPSITTCHAGLECGIISKIYPEVEIISIGPTIKGAHSPQEMVSISSVQKFWNFCIEILKQVPLN